MADEVVYLILCDIETERLAARTSRMLSAGCEPCGGLTTVADRLCQAVVFRGTAATLLERVRKTSEDDAKEAQMLLRDTATGS